MARKRLNKNLVVALTLSGFAMMIVLAMVMIGRLQQRDPRHFVELAEQREAQGDWEQAVIFYNEAWKHTQDPVYLVRVSKMALSMGDLRSALTGWQRALVARPDLMEAHVSQLEVLLEIARLNGRLDDWRRVRDAAQAMLDVRAERSPSQEAFAHNAKGLALVALQSESPANADEGYKALAEAARLAPDEVDYPIDVAMQDLRADRRDAAESALRELLRKHVEQGASASKVRLGYARYLAATGEIDESEKYFQEAVTFAGQDLKALREARLGHAGLLAQRWAIAQRAGGDATTAEERFKQSETILKQIIDAEPDHYDAYIQLTLMYRSAARHADAVAICERRLSRPVSRKGVDATRNKVSAFRLMIYGSESCVSQAVAAQQRGEEDARLKLLARAEQFVADARGEFPEHPRVLSQSGRIKVAQGRFRAALSDLRAAEDAYKAFDTVDWENKVLLAQVHLQLDEPGAARQVLESVTEQARAARVDDPSFWTSYAQTLFRTGELDRALALADRVLLIDPSHKEAAQLKAAVYERKGQRAEAGKIIEGLTGDKVMGALLQARQHALDGRSDAALAVLKRAWDQQPGDFRLVSALANELVNQGRVPEAREIVTAALKTKPDDVELRRLSVLVDPTLNDQQRDAALLDMINAETDGFERSLQLVSLYLKKSDPKKALEAINAAEQHVISKDTPAARAAPVMQHRALLRAKVHLAAQVDDQAAMDAARASAITHDVDGAGGKSIVGLCHLARKENEQAAKAFREVLVAQPTDAWSLSHLGQSLQLLGRLDDAEAAYERALRASPDESMAHRGLALLARTRGDEDTFRKHLARCEELIPNDPWVVAELTRRKEETDPAAAVRRREADLSARPDDLENIKRLATLSEQADQRDKADKHYARWLELAPDDIDALAAAAAYYRRSGRPDLSLAALQRFAASRTDRDAKARADMLIAEHHFDVGAPDAAEKVLLAAADTHETGELDERIARFYLQDVQEPRKAVPWINRAIERARAEQPADVPRLLVTRVYCHLHRAVGDLDAARKDVDELRGAYPDDPRGLFWQSELHARAGRIAQAIAVLSDYLAQRPDEPFARFQRAQLYVAYGQTNLAIEDLQSLKATDPLALQLEPRILLASLHERSGRRDLALEELVSLVADAPDSARAIEEIVSAYLRAGRPADADRVVTAQLNRDKDHPRAEWYFQRGRVSLAIGEVDKALADYQRGADVAQHAPAAMIPVLDVFAQVGRFAEGASYYEQNAPKEEKNATLRSRYAHLLMRAGQKPRAIDEFRAAMAIAIADASDATRVVAGDLRRSLTTPESLREAPSLFENGAPSGAMGRANDRLLVRLYRWNDRAGDASTRLDRLIQTSTEPKERSLLLQEKGEILQLAGENQAAREAYEASLREVPGNWAVLNNLAYLLSDQFGENKQALPYAQRAVAILESAPLLDTLGWIYVGLGQLDQAVAELSRAVRLDPGAALYHYHLGEAYRRNGQASEALNVLQTGRQAAVVAKDSAMIEKIDASLERVSKGDRAP